MSSSAAMMYILFLYEAGKPKGGFADCVGWYDTREHAVDSAQRISKAQAIVEGKESVWQVVRVDWDGEMRSVASKGLHK